MDNPLDTLNFHIKAAQAFWAEARKRDPRVIDCLTFPRGYRGCWCWTGNLRGRQPIYGHKRLYGKPVMEHLSMRRYFYELIIGPLPSGEMALMPGCPAILPLIEAGYVSPRLSEPAFEKYRRCVNPFHARHSISLHESRQAQRAERLVVIPKASWTDLYDEGLIDLWRWAKAEQERRERAATERRELAAFAQVLVRRYQWPESLAARVTGQSCSLATAQPPPKPKSSTQDKHFYLPGMAAARARSGMSHRQLGGCTGIPRATLYHMEMRERRTTLARATCVAEALGVPLSALTESPDALAAAAD